MAGEPEPPIQPLCDYVPDPHFPVACDVELINAYCCLSTISDDNNFVVCEEDGCVAGTPGPDEVFMRFPLKNDDEEPMLKTALGGTTMSPWVRVAFQQYCGNQEDPDKTAHTIITMGNISQPCNSEQCKATIKSFQYTWGVVDKGNHVRFQIMDQKGSEFQSWIQRLAINPEADTSPVQGKFRMKVQWGWYVTGGAEEDICGQPAQPLVVPDCEGADPGNGRFPNVPPDPGFNSAYIICSPVCWFEADSINVNWDQGKFVYEIDGFDAIVRSQENLIQEIFGDEDNQIYFTKAVELLGLISFPQFRVEFKAVDANGDVVDMQFVKADTNPECREFADDGYADCKGYGPLGIFRPNTRSPIACIQEWISQEGVFARDLKNKVTSDGGRVGITMNFDPTYKFSSTDDFKPTTNDPCAVCANPSGSGQPPQYGRLILWAAPIPYCQGNSDDKELNAIMKAVYVVNGGNCSPVLSFNPNFRWHFFAGQRNAGGMEPANNAEETVAVDQTQGFVKTDCPIAASRGPIRQEGIAPTSQIQKTLVPALQTQEGMFHHIMTNLDFSAIEADLRVQGDPSGWLCGPAEGTNRCVGIIFVNPYFLVDDPEAETVKDCPVWLANDQIGENEDVFTASTINKVLTNKGYYVAGADHQIKDGQYITTLKLKLVAPGAELNQAQSIVNLGGWASVSPTEGGTPVVYGGRFGCLTRQLLGNQGVSWGDEGTRELCGLWVGGGPSCAEYPNYTFVPDPLLPPECAECDLP